MKGKIGRESSVSSEHSTATTFDVPEINVSIGTADGKSAAIGVPGETGDIRGVCLCGDESRSFPLPDLPLRPARHDQPVASGIKAKPARSQSDRQRARWLCLGDRWLVPRVGASGIALEWCHAIRHRIEVDEFVLGSRRHPSAIWGEVQRVLRFTGEPGSHDEQAPFQVPHPHPAIQIAHAQILAIGAEQQGVSIHSGSRQAHQFLLVRDAADGQVAVGCGQCVPLQIGIHRQPANPTSIRRREVPPGARLPQVRQCERRDGFVTQVDRGVNRRRPAHRRQDHFAPARLKRLLRGLRLRHVGIAQLLPRVGFGALGPAQFKQDAG